MTLITSLAAAALTFAPAATVVVEPSLAARPGPANIVAAAPAGDWAAIAPADLLVMDLAPDARGRPRRVVIQLMSRSSLGWVNNIRELAAVRWWDGTSVYRVQDNYVAQWGDATELKPLPRGLSVMTGDVYSGYSAPDNLPNAPFRRPEVAGATGLRDPYATMTAVIDGWPMAEDHGRRWPVHCYGSVGVARGLSPDTGTGAELYAVIGHAPRQLDRNIAVVGRVIEGIEHLSALPRGTGDLGFYETAEERVPIRSVRMGTAVPDLPRYQYLATGSASFARYADARANRRDPFFIVPAGGADICNVPVPVRRARK